MNLKNLMDQKWHANLFPQLIPEPQLCFFFFVPLLVGTLLRGCLLFHRVCGLKAQQEGRGAGATHSLHKTVVAVLLSVEHAVLDEDGDGSQDEGHKQVHVNEVPGAVELPAETRQPLNMSHCLVSCELRNYPPVLDFKNLPFCLKWINWSPKEVPDVTLNNCNAIHLEPHTRLTKHFT